MTQTIYLSRPAILSALGAGEAETLDALFAERNTLTAVSGCFHDKTRKAMLGKITTLFAPLPPNTPDYLISRNNQLLETAVLQIDELLQDAVARYGADRVAVVIGTSTTGSDENEKAFRRYIAGTAWPDTGYSQEKQLLASPALYLAWRYGITAAAYGISTACTSGAKAIVAAARMLNSNLADAVICGGCDNLSLFTINGFDSLSVLSDAPCRPFGGSQGINIGEGAAVFLATRNPQPDSIALLGYGSSSDAYHMSTPRPDGAGALAVMRESLARAELAPKDIGWINAHGTGTQANDTMEAAAIHTIFADRTPVTSTKAKTAHTLGAAGAIEAAAAWLIAARRTNPDGRIPAQGYALAPELAPLQLADGSQMLQDKRRVLSNSFAFGGNNTAVLIGEADA